MVVLCIQRGNENIENIYSVNCWSIDYDAFESSPKSETEKEQFKKSGKDFLPHKVCEHIEDKYSQSPPDAICINLSSIGLESSVLLACHLRLHNQSEEISRLPIILIVNDLLEYHKSVGWKELRQVHKFRQTDGFLVSTHTDLSKVHIDETGIEKTGLHLLIQETIRSKRFPVSDLGDFAISTSAEVDSSMSNHSIVNEWAMFRWAKTIGCDETDELAKVFQKVETNLYFKYLRAIHPISEVDQISPEELKINYEDKPRVLLIDDEAENKWNEIFEYLLTDLNKIYTDYLEEDFRNLNQKEIIDRSIEKIRKDDIDVIILDFRLNPNDFIVSNPDEFSSIRLLKKVKSLNPGIQVIIFSATNKVWNLQALQNADADGFIFKDGSQNIHQTIKSFTDLMSLSMKKASWLKPIYKSFNRIKTNAKNLSDPFKASLLNNLSICFELLSRSFETEKYINYAYLQLFLIVEEFIKEDSVFEFGDNCYVLAPLKRYLVLSKKDPTNKDSAYKSALVFSKTKFRYTIGKSEYTNRIIDTYYKMSAILLFRYGMPNSSHKNWNMIINIRNQKAAHPEKGIVQLKEVNMLAEFLEFILDESKISPIESSKALKEPSWDEKMETLKKNFGH